MFCISISSGYGDSTWHNGSIVERKEIVRGGGVVLFFLPDGDGDGDGDG